MYVFDVRYENFDIEEEESIIIKISRHEVKCEKEAFIEAMSRAYDIQTESISLHAIVFIGYER